MKSVWLRPLGMAMALALGAGSAHAGDALFSPMERAREKGLAVDESFQALIESPATASLQLVQADAQAVNEKAAALILNLEPGLELRAYQVESYVNKSGILVWSGVLEDLGWSTIPFSAKELRFNPVNYVTMVRNGDKITGNVHFEGVWYQIRPLHSGGHAIVAVDRKAMPPDHPREYANLPVIPMPRRSAPLEKVDTVIRVLVNYTASAAAASGDIVGLINLAVVESNQGYTNSDVFIDMELAGQGQTTYTESGDFDTDLTRYRTPGDGFMDEIHTTRDSVAADVALLVINNTAYCGLASGIGSTAATAFATAYWGCITGYYSFAHEIGHLQSARHDPLNDSTNTPYAYGHGFQSNFSNPRWRTIMAYDCLLFGCPRLNYWSNPNKTYNGRAMGTANRHDNARVLNDTRATVAAYR